MGHPYMAGLPGAALQIMIRLRSSTDDEPIGWFEAGELE